MSDDPNNPTNLKDTANRAEEMRENLLIALDNSIKLNELEKEKALVLGQQLDAAQNQLDINTAIARQASDTLSTIIKQAESLEGAVMTAEQFRAILDKMTSHTMEGVDAQNEYKRILEDIRKTQNMSEEERIQALKKAKKEMEELRAKMEDVKNFGDKFDKNLSNFGRNFGIASNLSSTMSGNMGKMAADFSRGFSKDKMMMITKSFQQFGITILASIIDKVAGLAIELDTLSKEFERANGFGVQFEETIQEVDAALINIGLRAKDTSAAFQSLVDNFSSFNNAALSQNVETTKIIGALSKLGVSTQVSTKSIEILSKTFGKTGKESALMFAMIARSGNDASISNKKMAADFEANFSSLVQFGDRAVEVFQGLAAQSKATGVEMSSLINIAKKFDTFEGAAKSAAQLNAVLGVNISMMDLLYAEYDDKISIIQDGLSGIDYESLSRFEKNIIANALGAKDAYEAQRILNGEADQYEDKMKMQAQTQEDLLQLARENIPLMERMALALDKVGRAMKILLFPFIIALDIFLALDDATAGLLAPLLTLGTAIGGIAAYVASAVGGIASLAEVGIAIGLIAEASALVIGAVGVIFGFFATGYVMVSNALKEAYPAFEIMIGVMDFLVGGFLAGAAAVIMFGTPIGWVLGLIALFSGLAMAFREQIYDYIIEPIGVFFGLMRKRESPAGYELPGVLAAGFMAMLSPIRLAGQAIQSFGSIISNVYNIVMKKFIGGLKDIANTLTFGIFEDDDEEKTDSPSATPATDQVKRAAGAVADEPEDPAARASVAIQQAATEVKTLVIAQLRETGIKETAEELAKIVKTLDEKEMTTNVSIDIDGRPLKDFIMRTIMR